MAEKEDVAQVASSLWLSISLFTRQVRQMRAEGEISLPEAAALKRLEWHSPQTVTELARVQQISVQAIGATLSTLESKGLTESRPDPNDGRRAFISITAKGRETLRSRRDARTTQVTAVLKEHFDEDELKILAAAAPLIERLSREL